MIIIRNRGIWQQFLRSHNGDGARLLAQRLAVEALARIIYHLRNKWWSHRLDEVKYLIQVPVFWPHFFQRVDGETRFNPADIVTYSLAWFSYYHVDHNIPQCFGAICSRDLIRYRVNVTSRNKNNNRYEYEQSLFRAYETKRYLNLKATKMYR